MINFTSDINVLHKIEKVMERANPKDRLSFEMDIDAAHSNGTPLDFDKLLAFDDFNFWHDINGIQRHINRETGKIENCFSPRCSK
jgi:hypothetical protein